MELNYQLAETDFRLAQRVARGRFKALVRRSSLVKWFGSLFWFLLFLTFLALFGLIKTPSGAINIDVVWTCVFAAATTAAFIMLVLATRREYQLVQSRSAGPFPMQMFLRTNDEGVEIGNKRARTIFSWSVVTDCESGKDYVALILRQSSVSLIPRRAFSSEADYLAFVDEVRARIRTVVPARSG